MLAALAVLAETETADRDDDRIRSETEEALATVVDPVGTLYRYCFASSLLADVKRLKEGG